MGGARLMAVSLAVDIGAESGRVVRGELTAGALSFAEVHRFRNVPQRLNGLRWDVPSLLAGVKAGMSPADSIGIDTWGVDYGLLDAKGGLLRAPYHYRDARTHGVMESVLERLGADFVFRQTGTQFMPFNTLFQLCVEDWTGADRFLPMADLLHHQLTGSTVCEFSMAMTTQCYDPRRHDWAWPLIEAAGLPASIFPKVVMPGTRLGAMDGVAVLAPASHDTASAAASALADAVWISSGTWSILGVNRAKPMMDDPVRAANFTNEGAADGTFRLCKNVMGMWLLQQCREAWGLDYETLCEMGAVSSARRVYFDPDDPSLLAPGDMPARIATLVGRELEPREIVRAILEGLAFKYRYLIEQLQVLTGERYVQINIVGGGSQNQILNQLVADICGVPVIAGPVEATAIGNLLCQFVALGELESLEAGRALVGHNGGTFRPRESWDGEYREFKERVCAK